VRCAKIFFNVGLIQSKETIQAAEESPMWWLLVDVYHELSFPSK